MHPYKTLCFYVDYYRQRRHFRQLKFGREPQQKRDMLQFTGQPEYPSEGISSADIPSKAHSGNAFQRAPIGWRVNHNRDTSDIPQVK